jgi:hypothetical protein
MSKSTRLFSRSNYSTGATEWYFKSREGILGPYHSQQTAAWALDEYLRQCAASRPTEEPAQGLSEQMPADTAGQPLPISLRNSRLN